MPPSIARTSIPSEDQADRRLSEEEHLQRLRGLLLSSEHDELQALSRRLGTLEQFQGNLDVRERTIAEVLPEALGHAAQTRPSEMVAALGPALNESIQAEMLNSREEMVAMLQPLTGRLVKGAVADSFARLSAQINETVEAMLSVRSLKLRLKAIITGQSLTDLVISELRSTEVRRVYLIERKSGKLLFCWSRSGASDVPDEETVEELMTTVHVMAEFASERQDIPLRSLTLSQVQIFLQASPQHIVAIEAAGTMTEARQRIVSHACKSMLSSAAAYKPGSGKTLDREAMNTFAMHLASKQTGKKRKRRTNPAYVLGLLLLLGFVTWFGWRTYHDVRIHKAAVAIEDDIKRKFRSEDLILDVTADRADRKITVRGVGFGLQNVSAMESKAVELSQPYTLDFAMIVRDLESARLERNALSASLSDAQIALAEARREVAALRARPAPVIPVPQSDPVADLRKWSAQNAIFFTTGSTPRDGTLANQRLDELAALLVAAPQQRLRIEGFADRSGPSTANISIARNRAELVANGLVNRGIASERLIILGRSEASRPIADNVGETSPNRRVEFSLAFADE